MPLFYPDNLEHNNPNNPLMDVNQLKGQYNINLLSERDSIPLNKRSLTQSVGCRETERIYIYIGSTVNDIDWVNPSNWKSSASDAGGSYLPLSGGTLTGPLSATTISASTYYGVTSDDVSNLSNLTGNTVTEVFNYLPKYTKSDTAPLNPRVDDVWLDTNENRVPIEYIWFTDSNGDSSWVNWGVVGVSNGGISTGGTIITSGVTNIYYANSYQEFVTIIATIPVDVTSATIYANLGVYQLIDYGLTAHTHTLNIIATSELSLQGTWYMVKDTIEPVHMYIDGIISLGAETNNTILGGGINLYIKSFKNTNIQDQLVDGYFFYNTKDTNIDTPNGYRSDIWLPSLEFNSLGNTAHTHTISEINNLQSSLDSKLSLSGGTLTGGLTGTTIAATTLSATTFIGVDTTEVKNLSTLSGNTVTEVFNNATVSTDGIVLYPTDMIAGVREEVISGTTVQVNKFWSGELFTKPKQFFVFDKDSPLATDDYNIFIPDTNITITKVYYKTKATTVNFNINHSSNVDIWSSDKQATTAVQLSDVINNPNCLAGMPIKYQASAIGTTPTNIHVTIYYTEG